MPPITLLIKPASSLCNLRCSYCFYHDVSSHRETASFGVMREDLLETLVRKALAQADGQCMFGFQGGEPTLAGLDFYRRLVQLQKQYNIKNIRIINTIQTNGMLIDDEWAEFLAEHRFLVGLSLDGTREVHDHFRVDEKGNGTYDRVVAAARRLEKHHAEFNILCVVNNYVARYAKQVYQNLKKQGFRYIQFIPCLDPFGEETEKGQEYSLSLERFTVFLKSTFDLYYQDFEKGDPVSIRTFDNYVTMIAGYPPESCGMSGICSCYFVVEGDGSVYPCDFYVLDQYRLGHVEQEDFPDMMRTEAAKTFVAESEYIDEACRICRWLPICRGGCRRHREPFIDGRPRKNIYCRAYQEFFAYAYPRMERMAKKLLGKR